MDTLLTRITNMYYSVKNIMFIFGLYKCHLNCWLVWQSFPVAWRDFAVHRSCIRSINVSQSRNLWQNCGACCGWNSVEFAPSMSELLGKTIGLTCWARIWHFQHENRIVKKLLNNANRTPQVTCGRISHTSRME